MTLRRGKTIQKWWPTTQALDLVEGPLEAVATAVHAEVARFTATEPIEGSFESFENLDAAVLGVTRGPESRRMSQIDPKMPDTVDRYRESEYCISYRLTAFISVSAK
jgi:hypothetical protein